MTEIDASVSLALRAARTGRTLLKVRGGSGPSGEEFAMHNGGSSRGGTTMTLESSARAEPVKMQHRGSGHVRIVGPVTGLQYDFVAPGAVVAVDPQDAPAMRLLDSLRIVDGR